MKINKLFHWLYFILMMLPIFSIPIFAIYSHRHTIDSYSVTREEPYLVDYSFEQYIINGKPNDLTGWTYNVDDVSFNNNSVVIQGVSDIYIPCGTISATQYDKFFIKFDFVTQYTSTVSTYLEGDGEVIIFEELGLNASANWQEYQAFGYILSYTFADDVFDSIYFYIETDHFRLKNIQLFNLTTIFGSGNEPSLSECSDIFTEEYYDYGVTYHYVKQVGTHNVTYNDTDIGSQFTYQVYNVVDKYFNYDNVLNFGDLYSWLQLTFFNGNASLGFFIFWHLLIYWLLTSILWLVFDVLMYVPQLVHRWLDKASLS